MDEYKSNYQFDYRIADKLYRFELDRSVNPYEVRVNGVIVATHKSKLIGHIVYFHIPFEIENIQCAFILTNSSKVPRLMIHGFYANVRIPYGGLPEPAPPFFWVMAAFSALVTIGIIVKQFWPMLLSPALGIALARLVISVPPTVNKKLEPREYFWDCGIRWFYILLIWGFFTLIPVWFLLL